MKRRQFIKQVGIASAGVMIAPYLLPSGRLFAATGSRLANHVVFVLFAGGLRNQETVDMQYLANQGIATQGNVMPNMLKGASPASNLVYKPWTPILTNPLSTQGTLFTEMRYKSGPTGHYNGHTAALTGNYTSNDINIGVNPSSPTIFEYYRKHNDPAKAAINAWWLSEGLGPYSSLNYSKHPEYGPIYGANYLRPMTTFTQQGYNYFNNIPDFQPDDITRISTIKDFLDRNFSQTGAALPGIHNTNSDKEKIKQFIKSTIVKTKNNQIEWALPSGITQKDLTGDLVNVSYAWEVMNTFEPELMVINTFNSDVCHNDFSNYITNLHRADFGIGWLWNKIQSHPKLKDDTVMICMPEHGRNLKSNTITDKNGLNAYDHTSDDNSRRVFGLVLGPKSIVKQGQVVGTQSSPKGESIDVVPTIAHILGFKDKIPSGMISGSVLQEAFV